MGDNWKKNIILFLASQTVSLFGSSLVQYAIYWHITLETQSGIMMTIYIICGFLPTFFLSPFAGVWADRYNRKTLIILSDSLIAVSTLIMAILYMMGYKAIWLLFLISAARALGAGIQTPAIGAILPQLVPEDKLTKVNGTNGSIQAFVTLISPMISGALLSFITIEKIFFIDVVTAAIAVSILLVLKVAPHAKALEKQTTSYFDDMYKGFAYIKDHAFVKKFFRYCAIFFVLAAPSAFLTGLQVTRSFGNDVWRLSAIEVSFSVGMIAGGIIITSWGGFKNRTHTMIMASLIFGACSFALGSIPVFWIYLAFMALCGIAMPFFNTPSMVLLQEKVEPDYLGRVFGVLGMISSALMPLGMLVFGPISDYVRIEWLLMGTGILLTIQGLALIGDKVLIEAGQPLAKPESVEEPEPEPES